MPRKRTFQDPKFSVGDANSKTYRDNWDAVFGERKCRMCGGKPDEEHSGLCCVCFEQSLNK